MKSNSVVERNESPGRRPSHYLPITREKDQSPVSEGKKGIRDYLHKYSHLRNKTSLGTTRSEQGQGIDKQDEQATNHHILQTGGRPTAKSQWWKSQTNERRSTNELDNKYSLGPIESYSDSDSYD
jgi:hypothetical protein